MNSAEENRVNGELRSYFAQAPQDGAAGAAGAAAADGDAHWDALQRQVHLALVARSQQLREAEQAQAAERQRLWPLALVLVPGVALAVVLVLVAGAVPGPVRTVLAVALGNVLLATLAGLVLLVVAWRTSVKGRAQGREGAR
jgi:hypothetical protein